MLQVTARYDMLVSVLSLAHQIKNCYDEKVIMHDLDRNGYQRCRHSTGRL